MKSRLAWIALVSFGITLACWAAVALSSAMGWIDDDPTWAVVRGCAPAMWTRPGEIKTIDLAWAGSDAVTINIPARVHFQPGPKAEASISGDAEVVSHVRMRDGTLAWDTTFCVVDNDLTIRLSGPAVTAWTVNGSGTLELADIKQDALRIVTRGSGTITGHGQADRASVDVSGSGNVDLSRLVTRNADARIRGSADVQLAPRDDVAIEIYGSGIVSLHGW
jgi:hypothetical protein